MRKRDYPEYSCWLHMIQRCTNPKRNSFRNYGGRGIAVCEKWRNSFEAFRADVGPRPSAEHSLDRINNDGNYEPGNVRWATRKEQQANSRQAKTNIARFGVPLGELARQLGVSGKTIKRRADRGCDITQSLGFARTGLSVKRGESSPNAILTADAVRAIRKRCSSGESCSKVAREIGISNQTVSKIVRRKAWAHVL